MFAALLVRTEHAAQRSLSIVRCERAIEQQPTRIEQRPYDPQRAQLDAIARRCTEDERRPQANDRNGAIS